MKFSSIFNHLRRRSGTTYDVDNTQNGEEPKFSAVESTVSEYVQKSTIHGISYVGDGERNKFERIWWFVMLICSTFGACYLIYQAYRTMNENPIIESPALNKAPLWYVPFPAFTICPTIKKELTTFALNKTNWPDFAQKFLPKNLFDLSYSLSVVPTIDLQNLLLQRSDQDNYKILSQALPEIKVKSASWLKRGNEIYDITWQKTITSIGACITFNMYDEKDLLRDGVIPSTLAELTDKKEQLWSRDSDFTKGLPVEDYTYPLRALTINQMFLTHFNVNQVRRLSQFDSKFTVIFHTPDEVPLFERHVVFTTIKADTFSFVEITPHLVVSEGIEKYEPNVRNCYYTHERHLKYFKIYTQNHCELECLANYTLNQCGCVPYFMHHFNDTKICGTDLDCYWTALHDLFLPEFKDDGTHALIDDCNCLPTCTQLSYTIQVTELDRQPGRSSLQITYKLPFFTKNVRTELHSLSEFFSNCGGSLGLFLGVSIFSIIELIYFCTVRLYLHSKRSDREKSSEKTNER
ncbi:pickpocket protein 28-like [Bradysia coprophila]|uniref:pickpocket protein 28-like n=1 Tax=Bradysia coprophila TaxID=38358 RepID=UPI00187D85BC|nr:pickpocket protein 28-like [Bradysia coprophila]